jgi:hypothetical protein
MMRPRCAVVCAAALVASLAATPSLSAQSTPPDLSGVWQGTLTHIPARPGAAPMDVTVEIGPLPAADSACTPWRTTYAEGGTVRQVKDHRLCRGSGADDLYLDTGDGTRRTARWIGAVLVTPFKVGDALTVSSIRLRGVFLEEEILTVQDRPAVRGVQPLVPRGIQRLVLRRRPI